MKDLKKLKEQYDDLGEEIKALEKKSSHGFERVINFGLFRGMVVVSYMNNLNILPYLKTKKDAQECIKHFGDRLNILL